MQKYIIPLFASFLISSHFSNSETYEFNELTRKKNAAINKITTTYIKELENLRDKYTKSGNLPKANFVQEAINKQLLSLDIESNNTYSNKAAALGGASNKLPQLNNQQYPSNAYYKMTQHEGGLSTARGKEIKCRFQKLAPSPSHKTLSIVIKANKKDWSGTLNEISILEASTKKKIGSIPSLRQGRTASIPLTIPASTFLDLIITVKNNNNLLLHSFNKSNIPEVYLTVE